MVGWSGVFSVVVTPFAENGEIDWAAFEQNVQQGVEDGVQGFVVAGSTGEFYSLADDERLRLFEVAKGAARGLPVIAGCSTLRNADTFRLAREAEKRGMDGMMLLPPLFLRPNARETVEFFKAVSQVSALPIMLYNNPARIGFSVSASLLESLASCTRVVALKDSSKDVIHLRECVNSCGDRLRIFVGFDTLIVPSVTAGAHGVVSMAAQVFGNSVVQVFEKAGKGDLAGANRLQDQLHPLYDAMYAGTASPYVVIKWAMRLRNRPGGQPRLPLLPPDEATCRKIEQAVSAVAL